MHTHILKVIQNKRIICEKKVVFDKVPQMLNHLHDLRVHAFCKNEKCNFRKKQLRNLM